ncbi:hypothetical protein FGB62_127g028 [Gracilaria domingensis]|nr:hypothetical protein FGB62_127g028 [Gracilaria domingensis]
MRAAFGGGGGGGGTAKQTGAKRRAAGSSSEKVVPDPGPMVVTSGGRGTLIQRGGFERTGPVDAMPLRGAPRRVPCAKYRGGVMEDATRWKRFTFVLMALFGASMRAVELARGAYAARTSRPRQRLLTQAAARAAMAPGARAGARARAAARAGAASC